MVHLYRQWFYFLTFLISLNQVLAESSPMTQSIAEQELVAHGKKAFMLRCSGCHGEKGDGLGPAAAFLNPKPRDFTKGIFKFRSSPPGSMPSDSDLMLTLSKGILGTSMPSFADVPEQERFAIVQYIKTFSKLWEDRANYQAPVHGAPFPENDFRDHKAFIARAEKGRALFVESCVACHGALGHGDGPGAADLTDDWGQPIHPADFGRPYIKQGKSVKDIYKTILVGVNGTPMTAFKDAYTDDQLWDLTAWVLYLRGYHNQKYSQENPPVKMISAQEM